MVIRVRVHSKEVFSIKKGGVALIGLWPGKVNLNIARGILEGIAANK